MILPEDRDMRSGIEDSANECDAIRHLEGDDCIALSQAVACTTKEFLGVTVSIVLKY